MLTSNSIDINADADRIFDYAQDVERWPEILPHYRWVNVIWQQDNLRIVEMAATRYGIPVKWLSLQFVDSDNRRILFRHIGGLTRGMMVEWGFEQDGDALRVSITHELSLKVPVIRSRPGEWVVGEMFVKSIADKTLRQIKRLAER